MLNSSTHKQRKQFQENSSRYLHQPQPDESVSSNTELEAQEPDIRRRLERPSKKKVSVKIRNLDIDSDIIKEEDSEDYISEKQSQQQINPQQSNAVLNYVLEEEVESPFKSRNHYNQEILWSENNQDPSHPVEAQPFNTPKQHQVVDSPQIESAIKSYKNLNTMKSLYSPMRASQNHKINDETIYQHYNFCRDYSFIIFLLYETIEIDY